MLKGFIQTSFIDWKGHLSSVIFTGGCNFRCPYCHNRDLVLGHQSMDNIPMDYILFTLHKYRHWTDHVVVTGGEPTIHAERLMSLIMIIKKEGFAIKLDTNGSCPERVQQCIEEGLVDYVAMDVKGPVFQYAKWAGVDVDNQKIDESIDTIMDSGIDHEFRMTVVPTLHQESDIQKVADRLRGAKRFFIQRFRPTVTLDTNYQNVAQHSIEEFQALKKQYEISS